MDGNCIIIAYFKLYLRLSLRANTYLCRYLYIAKYYISVQKWIPAINRLKIIENDYDQTVFIEEALHRLVEINYFIGRLIFATILFYLFSYKVLKKTLSLYKFYSYENKIYNIV